MVVVDELDECFHLLPLGAGLIGDALGHLPGRFGQAHHEGMPVRPRVRPVVVGADDDGLATGVAPRKQNDNLVCLETKPHEAIHKERKRNTATSEPWDTE